MQPDGILTIKSYMKKNQVY